jgi:hypothetical protein
MIPAAPAKTTVDIGGMIVKLVAGLLFLIVAVNIVSMAISQGPITIAGLIGISSYVGFLLYLVWRGCLEEEAEHRARTHQ